MSRLSLCLVASMVAAASTVASAGPLPYPNTGTVAEQFNFTATTTGNINGYLVDGPGHSGGDDSVRLVDVTTGTTYAYMLPNHENLSGASANFGFANAGDQLVFELFNSDLDNPNTYYHAVQGFPLDPILASSAAYSTDNSNHAYVTSFAGGPLNSVNYAANNYVYTGWEDLPRVDSDFNYIDTEFLFTNVTATAAPSAVPEPGSLVLLGTGALGAFAALRRKLIG